MEMRLGEHAESVGVRMSDIALSGDERYLGHVNTQYTLRRCDHTLNTHVEYSPQIQVAASTIASPISPPFSERVVADDLL
jgi:hypothetical protein